MLNKFQFLGILIIFGVIAISGCTSQNSSSAPNTVNIQYNAFNPNNLTVQAGTTVNWVNLDSNVHRVTSDSDVFDSNNLTKDQSYSFTFNQPGSYLYHCTIHPNEVGVIIVTGSSTTNFSTNTSNPQTNPSTPSSPSNPATPSTNSPIGYKISLFMR